MAERTAQRVWTTALGQLELYVTRANYETCLRHTAGLRVEPDNFVVGVPTALSLAAAASLACVTYWRWKVPSALSPQASVPLAQEVRSA